MYITVYQRGKCFIFFKYRGRSCIVCRDCRRRRRRPMTQTETLMKISIVQNFS